MAHHLMLILGCASFVLDRFNCKVFVASYLQAKITTPIYEGKGRARVLYIFLLKLCITKNGFKCELSKMTLIYWF